jgi:hypothetical protein
MPLFCGEIVYIAKGIASATTTTIIITISSTEMVLLINHKTTGHIVKPYSKNVIKDVVAKNMVKKADLGLPSDKWILANPSPGSGI